MNRLVRRIVKKSVGRMKKSIPKMKKSVEKKVKKIKKSTGIRRNLK